jgi:hypothetical protein
VGYSGPSDAFALVWTDFDPTTQRFGTPAIYGVIDSVMPTLPTPSVVAAPGRLLIASAWTDGSGQILLIQQCTQ